MTAAQLLACLLALLSGWQADCQSGAPVYEAAEYAVVANRNVDTILQLRSRVRIPDGGEVNSDIVVQERAGVRDTVGAVSATIRGLYHQYAGDLVVSLIHAGVTCRLLTQRGKAMTFGYPAAPNYPLGQSYTFVDFGGANLAAGRPTSMSAEGYGGASSRAVDGVTTAYYSANSVTHTAPSAGAPWRQPWWQVELAAPTPVQSVQLFPPAQEPRSVEVQRVTCSADELVSAMVALVSCGSVVPPPPLPRAHTVTP